MASFRGAASTGTSVPVSTRAPIGAHRCFPIIAQDFSPGLPCGLGGYGKSCKACPAEAHRSAGLKPRWF